MVNLFVIWRAAIVLPILVLVTFLFSQTHGQCSSHQFECTNKRCVPLTWRCDEDDDCGDNSDEQKCEIRTCSGTEFQCANEKCVPHRWQCDKEDDCGDNSDEDSEYCRNKTCSADQFMCGPSMCIPASWRCDGQEDCHDGTDEKADCFQITCTEEEFSCRNNKCIMKRWVCDQDNDCGDGSDEMNCPNVTCSGSEFMCSSGKCTPARWRCDGDIDCSDGSDEIGCPPDTFKSPCNSREFLCANRLDCIHNTWKCDGDPDCPDGSDEVNCTETCRQDQYRCKDHQCIPGHMECNGQKECRDGSDEEKCPELEKKSCDPQTQFDCGRTHCISIKLLCNGKNDCGEWEDEPKDKCFKNECSRNNGGCSQLCSDKAVGFVCECLPGYKLVDNKTCEDINECDIPGSCSQICINTKGHYKCDCHEGYALEPNSYHRCKAQEGHPALLFANRHDIRKINLSTFEYKAVVSNLSSTVSLDYVFRTGTVVWSDVAEECIKSAPLDNGAPVTNIIDTGISTPDGIAVDWLYNHIYWTDTGKNIIGVSDMLGRLRKTLISTELDEPRAIVVNPLEGWMFWSDWGEPSKIERAGMEGSHRETIITSDVRWPNGLAIDYVSRRIFWVDAKLHLLSSANYDGTNQRVVISSPLVIKHPFAIDVFEDWVYWTDWESEAIIKINKFTGEEISNVAVGIFSPMDVRVYHSYKQPDGTNYCKSMNGRCSHLCLPAPSVTTDSAKYACACPDNMTLATDQQNCVDKVVPVTTVKPETSPLPTIQPKRTISTKLVPKPTSSAITKKQNLSSSTTPSTTTVHLTTVQLPVTTAIEPSPSPKSTTVSSSKLPLIVTTITTDESVVHLTSETTEPELSTHLPSINDTIHVMEAQASEVSENEDADTGKIAGIIIGVLGGVAIITSLVAFLVYKQYLRRNVTSMNFDNPVYRKTTEDQFSLEKNQYQPARSYPPGLEPLTSPGTNEFV